MPEAIIVLLDNSSSSINGDYMPTRWDSQIDCASLLIQSKMNNDQQTLMGVGLMAGKQVQIVCTPTNDPGKATAYLYGIKQHGNINFCRSLLIASLSLKHRIQQSLRQRIIAFVASTISETPQQLKMIANKLRKNNVAVDLVCLGDISQNQLKKVKVFHDAVNHGDNSYLKIVEPTSNYLSDVMMSTPIFGGSGSNNFQMMNEADDPELAMALKMSLEEAQKANPMIAGAEANKQFDEQQLQRKALQLSLEQPKDKKDKDQEPNKKKQE